MRPWAIAAATLGTAVIVTGAFWATWPVPPEVHAPLRVAPERPLREAARREPRAPRRAEAPARVAKAPRRELREYRLDQAEAVRRRVGEDQFQSFVDAMDFSRFLGDQPVRGRLD